MTRHGKMKDKTDKFTKDAFAKRGRGRPPKVGALTPAERSRRYRERQAQLLEDSDPRDLIVSQLLELPKRDLAYVLRRVQAAVE